MLKYETTMYRIELRAADTLRRDALTERVNGASALRQLRGLLWFWKLVPEVSVLDTGIRIQNLVSVICLLIYTRGRVTQWSQYIQNIQNIQIYKIYENVYLLS